MFPSRVLNPRRLDYKSTALTTMPFVLGSHFLFALLGGHLLDCLCLCVLVVPCVASLRVCVVCVSCGVWCGVWCIECGCVLFVLGSVHLRLNCKP